MIREIARLNKLLKAANPTKWKVCADKWGISIDQAYEIINGLKIRNHGSVTQIASELANKQDANLIVGAVNALPGLIQRHEDLMSALEAAADYIGDESAGSSAFWEAYRKATGSEDAP